MGENILDIKEFKRQYQYLAGVLTSGSSASIWFIWMLSVMSHWRTTSWSGKVRKDIWDIYWWQNSHECTMLFVVLMCLLTYLTHQDFTVLLFVYILVTEHVTRAQHDQFASLLCEIRFLLASSHKYPQEHDLGMNMKMCIWPFLDERPRQVCWGGSTLSQLKELQQQVWSHSV